MSMHEAHEEQQEWKNHLRSAIHPMIFALCYRIADAVAEALKLSHHARSELLLAAPKILQALFAAWTDFYTWKLASYMYGADSLSSLMVLLLSIVSPWQWFCSTRTFSNSMEMTLTVFALYNWPWHWTLSSNDPSGVNSKANQQGPRTQDGKGRDRADTDEVTRLRRALLSAAIATILRPTNILVWASLTALTFLPAWKSARPSQAECIIFARETVVCGSTVLLLSTILDRIFYDSWVFPPFNFLHVNVVQSLSTFYGNNDWHYYISQGYPLLLTTSLPFTLVGLFRTLRARISPVEATPAGRSALRHLSIVCLLVPAAFSNIAHKEVRFIYPLLPALHVVTGLPLSSYFGVLVSRGASPRLAKQLLLLSLLALNVSISYYTTQIHNSGLISLTHYLRHEFEAAYLPSLPVANMTVGMLMPCHSTPWRSHLQYPPSETRPGIRAWALTCEPPLDLNVTEKATYLDEADMFYADPQMWLKKNMSRHPPRRKDGTRATGFSSGVFAPDPRHKRALNINSEILDTTREEQFWSTRQGRRPWPEYLIFFAQLEPTLQVSLRGSGYLECKRLFNSHWHDDRRRTGDVVVWCLDAGRSESTKTAEIPFELVEEAIHDPDSGTSGVGQKVLGGEKKPPLPGGQVRKKKKEPVTRVVEKSFWKIREPLD